MWLQAVTTTRAFSIDNEKNPQNKNQKRLYAYSMESFQLMNLNFLRTINVARTNTNINGGIASVIINPLNAGEYAVRPLEGFK